jgi:hypothetical protein
MSNAHAERKRVRFDVPSEVELDDGIVLAPGSYEGRTTHLGYIKHEEYTWTPKMHFLELDVHQSADLGGRPPENAMLMEYDVTKYVENGLIRVE